MNVTRIVFYFSFFLIQFVYAQKTVITGKVLNPRDSVVRLLYFNSFEGVDTLSKLTSKQEFKLVFELATPMYLRLKHANKYADFWVTPKDSVYLTFDPRDIEASLTVAGSNTAHYLYWKYSAAFNKKHKKPSFDFTPEEDANYTAALYKEKLTSLYEYKAANPNVSKSFMKFWELEYFYRPLNVKLIYPGVYAMNHKMAEEDLLLPDNYYTFLDTVPLNKNDHWMSFEYKDYLERVILHEYHRMKTLAMDYERDNYTEIYQLGKILLNNKYKWYSLANLVDYGISNSDDSTARSLMHLFIKECPLPNICIKMKQRHRNLQRFMSKEIAAPNFAAANVNNKMVALSDFNGKVVLLYFWATGCTQNSMSEILQKLNNKYPNGEVVFVDICLDESEITWQESLRKMDNTSIHLFQEGGEYSDAAQNYNIKDCAAFFVIDRNGYFSGVQMLAPSFSDLSNQIEIALGAKP